MASKCLGMQPNATKFTINKEKIHIVWCKQWNKDVDKFTEDTDSYLIGEELEDSLKKSKKRH